IFDDSIGLVADHAGHLYVANGPSIRVVELATGAVTTVAVDHSVYSAYMPLVPALDGAGHLFVTTYFDARPIHEIDLATGAITSLASGIGGLGLVYDGNGELLVGSNFSVERVSLPSGDYAPLAGLPPDFGSDDGVGGAARFTGTVGLTHDPDAAYVAD